MGITKLSKKLFLSPIALFWFYIFVNMAPTLYFLITDPLNLMGKVVIFIFPLGLYFVLLTVVKNMGMWQIILLPLLVLHAFQIVLFYLFGEDVIAVDMFLNVVTTNATEVTELLGTLLPAIALVCLLYIPTLILAAVQWKQKNFLSWKFRKLTMTIGTLLMAISLLLSFYSENTNSKSFVYQLHVYPINAIHNLGFAVNKWDKVRRYPDTSKDFSYQATRNKKSEDRQIFVLIIGETSRADNWQIYGYERETNPLLSKQENLYHFEDVLTQSNTTHKSVSIIMSEAEADNYNTIYQKKGIIDAFKEAGFTTITLSNQAENHSFIEFFTKEADIYKTIRTTGMNGSTVNLMDTALIPLLNEHIDNTPGDLFIVIHTYGSHFNYMERYPKEFRKFTPDKITEVSKKQKEQLVNAYDNSILFTDYFLAETIKTLETKDAQTALLYISDHGEDLFDDQRGRFLHASPTPTYYQLRVPLLTWFSKDYIKENLTKIESIKDNRNKAVSSNAIFHTLLEIANINTPYLQKQLALTNGFFQNTQRVYLNDHDQAVPYLQMNLKKEDHEMLKKNNIKN